MVNLRKWVLALAIALVFNLFINYGISVFYKAPQYNDFCQDQFRQGPYPAKPYPAEFPIQQNCSAIEVSEALQGNCTTQRGYIAYKYNTTGCATEAYCETCQARFEDVNNKRNSNVFVILVVFGVIAIMAGIVVKAEAVANGFLFGGVLSIIIAAIRNWGQLQDVFKFVILGVVLALLIWIGYKKSGLSGNKSETQHELQRQSRQKKAIKGKRKQ
ncbi:hypothetical protein HYU40_02620 [Candidatus Woesearchaeota archaeon]|nr:hypothetical protein [Candidatus Woesearchaeota archaeon]